MKNPQLALSLIQTVLLAALVVLAIRISGQLPTHPAPTQKDFEATRFDYKARKTLESRIPLTDVHDWPESNGGRLLVEVENWPHSLPVEIQNTVDVEVQNTVGVNVQNTVDVEVVR